jgi:GLPGLI family protein
MKNILITVAVLLATTAYIKAQTVLRQGTIDYDMTVNLREQIAKKNPAVAALVPKETHVLMTVSFKNDIFSGASRDVTSSEKLPGTSLQLSAGMDEKKIIDLKKRTVRGEYKINGKKYFVDDVLQPATAIVYTKETKQLLGYTVTKAFVTDNGKKYTVWFTTQIPNSYSPEADLFAGLKGTVLEYSTNEYTCRATAINADGFKPAAVAADTTARKISKEQLEDLQEDAASQQVRSTATQGNGNKRQVTEKMIIKL